VISVWPRRTGNDNDTFVRRVITEDNGKPPRRRVDRRRRSTAAPSVGPPYETVYRVAPILFPKAKTTRVENTTLFPAENSNGFPSRFRAFEKPCRGNAPPRRWVAPRPCGSMTPPTSFFFLLGGQPAAYQILRATKKKIIKNNIVYLFWW